MPDPFFPFPLETGLHYVVLAGLEFKRFACLCLPSAEVKGVVLNVLPAFSQLLVRLLLSSKSSLCI